MTRDYTVIVDPDDNEGTLHVNLTDEGLIVDLIYRDEIVGTWALTAQEFTDRYFA